jgi:Protein  of unknown function (DUF3018)
MNDASPARQDKFRAYRARKKAQGLREVRLWVPDIRSAAFEAEARRQASLLDHSDDEREAAAMMSSLAVDAWNRED